VDERQGRHLKAGEYRFDRAMTPFEVIDKIARGDVYVVNVTFPEGLTIAEMAKIFESHGLGRRGVRPGGEGSAPIRARSGGDGSRGLSVSRDLRAAAPTDAAKLVR
jgi:cell division protein YceG involved in septum cleavage